MTTPPEKTADAIKNVAADAQPSRAAVMPVQFAGDEPEALEVTVERLTAQNTELLAHLTFVERWANHHGQKPHVTAQEALSCIQHFPPIKAITRGYADGRVPLTFDPFAEIERLKADQVEPVGRVGIECPDGGKCHHSCASACWRKESGCGPLSISGLDDNWRRPVREPSGGSAIGFTNEKGEHVQISADARGNHTIDVVLFREELEVYALTLTSREAQQIGRRMAAVCHFPNPN